MAIAVALILLVLATVLFHVLSPWWFTPIASNWTTVDDTVDVTFWVTGIVFVAVNLFLAFAILRYRHGKAGKAHYEPENRKLEWWLTIGTSVGIAAMLAPGLAVWARFVTVPDDAHTVEVLGQQWNWSYRFPGEDGVLGKSDANLISTDNPFGLDFKDVAGNDDVLVASNELHLPLGEPVKILLRSKDVNHQFAVPQFRVKMDMVPGMVTYFWLTPTRTGRFDVLCEQLCGLAHFAMRGRVIVDEPRAFQQWLAAHPTSSALRAHAHADLEAGKALYAVCSSCHGPQGEGNEQLNAPKLAGQPAWYLVRQLENFKAGHRGTHKDDVYGQQMVAMTATLPDAAAIRNVSAYIASLPDAAVRGAIAGNLSRGHDLYQNCAVCHGDRGEGNWSTHAPRLANTDAWYMERQLTNFRLGIRGTHPEDFHGSQMRSMARMLDEQSTRDVMAYIRTL